MKYSPKKVFVLENGQYTEITFEELQRRENEVMGYKDKYFLPLHGVLMEVTKEEYAVYYKNRRRQKYIDESARKSGLFSYDALTTDDFNGEDVLVDRERDVEREAETRLLLEILRSALKTLSEEEKKLVKALYFEGYTEREWARISGIPQKTINDRKHRILKKIKKNF